MTFSDLVRVERSRVYLPSYTLVRQKRTVVLIGMMHLATEEFFREVQLRLLSYERSGYRVMYEAIDPGRTPTSQEERLAQKRLAYKRAVFARRMSQIGLAYQSVSIKLLPTWTSADFNSDDWDREMPELGPRTAADTNQIDRYIDHPEIVAKELEVRFRNLLSFDIYRSEVIIDRRNEVAVTKVLEAAENSNVVTFWGAGHLPGMTKLLLDSGFVLQQIEWIEALDLAKIKVESARRA